MDPGGRDLDVGDRSAASPGGADPGCLQLSGMQSNDVIVCLPYHSPGRDRFRWMDGEQKNQRTPDRYINPAPRTLQRASLAGVSQQYDTALITKLQMSADY